MRANIIYVFCSVCKASSQTLNLLKIKCGVLLWKADECNWKKYGFALCVKIHFMLFCTLWILQKCVYTNINWSWKTEMIFFFSKEYKKINTSNMSFENSFLSKYFVFFYHFHLLPFYLNEWNLFYNFFFLSRFYSSQYKSVWYTLYRQCSLNRKLQDEKKTELIYLFIHFSFLSL